MLRIVSLTLALGVLGLLMPSTASALDHHRHGHAHHHGHRHGLMITHVAHGSAAAHAGLEPGDVIVELDRKPVHTPREFYRQIQHAGRHAGMIVRNVRTGRLVEVRLHLHAGHLGASVRPITY